MSAVLFHMITTPSCDFDFHFFKTFFASRLLERVSYSSRLSQNLLVALSLARVAGSIDAILFKTSMGNVGKVMLCTHSNS